MNYNTTIAKDHNIGVMAGYQEWYKYWNSSSGSLKGLIDESINVPGSATEMLSIGGSADDRSTRSWFGRINYDYKGRYLFEANIRYDGNSRYGKIFGGVLSHHSLQDGDCLRSHSWNLLALGWTI